MYSKEFEHKITSKIEDGTISKDLTQMCWLICTGISPNDWYTMTIKYRVREFGKSARYFDDVNSAMTYYNKI